MKFSSQSFCDLVMKFLNFSREDASVGSSERSRSVRHSGGRGGSPLSIEAMDMDQKALDTILE